MSATSCKAFIGLSICVEMIDAGHPLLRENLAEAYPDTHSLQNADFYRPAWNADEVAITILSVRLSVKCVHCDKSEQRSVHIFIPYERSFYPSILRIRTVGEGRHFYLKFWVNRPPLERNRRF